MVENELNPKIFQCSLMTPIINSNYSKEKSINEFLRFLLRHEVKINLIPKIHKKCISLSIRIPRQKSSRLHIFLYEKNIKSIDFELSTSLLDLLKINSKKTNISNYLIFIKRNNINFSNKRSSFLYIDIDKLSVYKDKRIEQLVCKGLPLEFYSNNNKLNELTGKEWIKYSKSWFILSPPARKKEEILHPAKFPETLIDDFIKFFTKTGDFVVDPFLGTGSTMISCCNLGRNFFGIEINKKYYKIIKRRLDFFFSEKLYNNKENFFEINNSIKSTTENNSSEVSILLSTINHKSDFLYFYKENLDLIFPFEQEHDFFPRISSKHRKLRYIPICGDSRNIYKEWKKVNLPKINFCITSPPYWNQLKHSSIRQKGRKKLGLDIKYSNNKMDIGNIDNYHEFLNEQKKIFHQVDKILKLRAYIVIITNNVYSNGRLYPLAFDTLKDLSDFWVPKDEKIWCQNDKALVPLGVNSAWVANRHHQYCLVFRKE